jgi:hypothetical protein
VTQRQCPRCHTALQQEDQGTLQFCWNCGAPQVVVSDELLVQAEKQRAALESGLAGELEENAAAAVVWPSAIRYAALAGAAAAALTLISFALPPVLLLVWFWAIGAPVVAIGVYSAKFRQTRLRPGFGARLGLLCGLAIFFAMSVVNTGGLLLARFVFHAATQIDGQLAAMFAQLRATIQAQGGPGQAAALAWLNIPEDRVGLLLSMFGIILFVYLGLSAAGGAFAVMLRGRGEQR